MIGKVLESSANQIITRMEFADFEKNKEQLKIGKYVKRKLTSAFICGIFCIIISILL